MTANHHKPAVTVYRTRPCPFCIAAEQLLRDRGVPFEEVYLDDHPNRRAFTANLKPGHYTVPLVMRGDEPIGGFDDLRALDVRGCLKAELAG